MYTMLRLPPANRDLRDAEQVEEGRRLHLAALGVRFWFRRWMLVPWLSVPRRCR